MSDPIRVLIVDDSRAIGAFLRQLLAADRGIEVVGQALDPYEARSMIKTLQPDVLTLDVEMPKMDGITFLSNLMRLRPMPVVMLSSLTEQGAEVSLDALALGAVDFLEKRTPESAEERARYGRALIERIRGAAGSRLAITRTPAETAPPTLPRSETAADLAANWSRPLRRRALAKGSARWLLAVGASTGGTEALRTVLENFYHPEVAVALVQHMPEKFMAPFAGRLNSISRFEVEIAGHLAPLQGGHAYVAPGDQHLEVRCRDGRLISVVTEALPVSGHRPSADVLFGSAAAQCAPATVGVLLTGMGEDGAVGMKALRDAGALTLVQDRNSSAVWGMPGSAVKLGGAVAELPLDQIGPTLQRLFEEAVAPSVQAAG
ncbi:MAG: chemotaxis response regulator protein-glutamate methylesterase [Pseudomonadota bacterium]